MKRVVLISFSLHVVVVAVLILSPLLKVEKAYPMGEVYSVSIVSRPVTRVLERTKKEEAKKEKESEKPTESKSQGEVGKVQTDKNFKYSYYLSTIITKIGENWRNPYKGTEISAVVHFFITRNGMIKDIKLHRTSGNYLFDQSVKRAVTITKNLPPLPLEYNNNRLGVFFEFSYSP